MKKINNIIKKNVKWILLLICLVVFLAISEDVFTHEIMTCDIVGYNLISKYVINDSLTPIMKCITWFGNAFALILIVLLLIIIIKNKKIVF